MPDEASAGFTTSPRVRGWAYAVLVVAAVGAITANVFRAEPLSSGNDRSRWCTVESLLSGHGFVIDEIDADPSWTTIDKVRHEGHFYSTKPPLLPVLVAGVTYCVETASGLDLRNDTRDVVSWVLLFVNVVPLAIALALLAWMCDRNATTDFARLFVVATAALGTLLVPFSTTFNNHTVAACSLVVSLAAASRILLDGDRGPWSYAVAGFFAAFTCANELPAAAFGVSILVMLHRSSATRTWIYFVPAAVVPLAAYLALNLVVTGGFEPFYAHYGTEKYVYVHEGVPSYWARPTGIDAARDSTLAYLFHCVLGHHGILSLTPVFLASVVTWISLPRWTGIRHANLCWLGCGLTVVVLGFYLTRTANYNYGGNTAGLRWTIWLIPFWLLAMLPAVDRARGLTWRLALLVALGASSFSAWASARTPWEPPWLFDVMERAGWIDYSEPRPELGDPLHTWFGSLPGVQVDGRPRWTRFRSVDALEGSESLRLTDRGPRDDGDGYHTIVVERDDGGTTSFWIDPEGLRGEHPFETAILDPRTGRAGPSPSVLTGLPRGTVAAFQAASIEHVRTPLRRDAFRCIRVVARALYRETEDVAVRKHYCEAWLSDEVPFGCVRFSTTVTDAETGALLSKRVWEAVEASDHPPRSPLVVTPSR